MPIQRAGGLICGSPIQKQKDKNQNNMKLLLTLFMAAGLLISPQARAADAHGSPEADLKTLVGKIKTGLQAGKRTAKSLETELAQFDVLLKKYKGQKTDAVSEILFMHAVLHAEVFKDIDKAVSLVTRLKKEYPNTTRGKSADQILEAMEGQKRKLAIQANMAVGKKFPDFTAKDVNGKPLSVAKFKGKVVLVDFWATWCGPCIAEMPNVIKAYEAQHKNGFEVIGISLDRDKGRMVDYTKKNGMPWPQYFDGLGWDNKIAAQYGIQSIPATFLIGPDGTIIGKDLRGHALEAAVTKALNQKL